MSRLAAFVALAVLGVIGVGLLSDLTQSRPDDLRGGTATEVVIAVDENRFGGGVDRAAAALWAVCAGQTRSQPGDGGMLQHVAADRYRVVPRPAIGDGERRKLVGCLEDFTIERVRGTVQSFREVPTRRSVPGT